MLTPKYLVLLLLPIMAVSQTEVQFHSENMKQRFIEAGADLNDDGAIHLEEAAQVTELYFGTEPFIGFGELDNIPTYTFRGHVYWPSLPNCIPSYNDDTEGGHPPVFVPESNFLGLESFTNLKALSISHYYSWNHPVTNLHISPSLETFILRNANYHSFNIPDNNSLTSIQLCVNYNSVATDLSSCTALSALKIDRCTSSFGYFTDSDKVTLPPEAKLTYLSSEIPLDISLLDLSEVRNLKLYDNFEGVDLSALQFLENLELRSVDTASEGEIVISLPNLKTVILDFTGNTIFSFENCTALKIISASGTNISRVQNNPSLEGFSFDWLKTTNQFVLANCPSLRWLKSYAPELAHFSINNFPSLEEIYIHTAVMETFEIANTPALEKLYFHKNASTNQATAFQIDFEMHPELSFLGLDKVQLSNPLADLSSHNNLSHLLLSDTDISTLICSGNSIDQLYIQHNESCNIAFSTPPNPINFSLENVNTFQDIDFSLFNRAERISLINTDVGGEIDLSHSDALTALNLSQNEIESVFLCSEATTWIHLENKSDVETMPIIYTPDEAQINDQSCGTYELSTCEILTDIASHSHETYRLYPNPVSSNLFINVNGNIPSEVLIYNLSGQLLSRNYRQDQTFDVSDLSSGIYFVAFEIDTRKFIEKIVVK